MTYVAQAHVAFGDMWTAASENQSIDNDAYLKSQTDLLYVTVYNSGAGGIGANAPMVLDPTYTSGLGVKNSTIEYDLRIVGVNAGGATLNPGSYGIMAVGGIQNVRVTGTIFFGHSLITSATSAYLEDSGGGGWGPGVFGWALASQASGTGTISAYIKPYTAYYLMATQIIRTMTNNAVPSGASVTAISAFISDGVDRLALVFGFNNVAGKPTSFVFNAGNFTAFQSGAVGQQYFGYLLPSAATANITADYTSTAGLAVAILLNGVNQGTPVGTYANNTATSVNVSVVVSTGVVAGDLCIAGFSTNAAMTVSGRGSGQTNLADITQASNQRMVVDWAIATGSSITFTWTISASMLWDACGVAVKSK